MDLPLTSVVPMESKARSRWHSSIWKILHQFLAFGRILNQIGNGSIFHSIELEKQMWCKSCSPPASADLRDKQERPRNISFLGIYYVKLEILMLLKCNT